MKKKKEHFFFLSSIPGLNYSYKGSILEKKNINYKNFKRQKLLFVVNLQTIKKVKICYLKKKRIILLFIIKARCWNRTLKSLFK